jgi:hypothetical protein
MKYNGRQDATKRNTLAPVQPQRFTIHFTFTTQKQKRRDKSLPYRRGLFLATPVQTALESSSHDAYFRG